MKNYTLILLFLTNLTFGQEASQEFLSGRLVKSLEDNEMLVSTSFRSSDKKYFTFDVYITNKGNSKTYRVKDFNASIAAKKGEKELEILSRNEFMKSQEKRDKRKAFFAQVGANIAAAAAAETTINNTTTKSGYSNTRVSGTVDSQSNVTGAYGNNLGSVNTKSNFSGNASTYSNETVNSSTLVQDGAARYNAQQIENQKVEEFKMAARQERSRWNSEYLKSNTIHNGETKKGLINIKAQKGNQITLTIVIENLKYQFEWDPEDAANL